MEIPGVLERKHVVVTDIKHIGKESDGLAEPFGLNEYSYEFYDDPEKVNREFRDNADSFFRFRTQRCEGYWDQ